MSDLVVRAEGLRKRFGTTQALDGVDLAMRRGTALGVLGVLALARRRRYGCWPPC